MFELKHCRLGTWQHSSSAGLQIRNGLKACLVTAFALAFAMGCTTTEPQRISTVLLVTKDGRYILFGTPVSETTLREELAKFGQKSNSRAIVVQMEVGGSYEMLGKAVSAAQEAGLKVGFVVGKSKE